MIRELEHLCYGDGLRQLRLLSLEERRLLSYCSPPNLKRAYKKDRETFCAKIADNGFKMKECRFRLHVRKKSSSVRVVRLWKKLPREAVAASTLEVFKAMLNGA